MDGKVVLITGAVVGHRPGLRRHLRGPGLDGRRGRPPPTPEVGVGVGRHGRRRRRVRWPTASTGWYATTAASTRVVTCAGGVWPVRSRQTPIAKARAQLDTNFFGTVRVVVAALPSLRARSGRIVLDELHRRGHRPALPGLLLGQQVRPRGLGRGSGLGAQAPRRARDPGRARELPHRVHRGPPDRRRCRRRPYAEASGQGHRHHGARTRKGEPTRPAWPRRWRRC